MIKTKFVYLILTASIITASLFFMVQPASAAQNTVTISGQVTDSNGTGIIAKAELVQGNVVYHVSSDQSGNYTVTIPKGTYLLKFSDYNQTIPNAPAYYEVEKTVNIQSTNIVNI